MLVEKSTIGPTCSLRLHASGKAYDWSDMPFKSALEILGLESSNLDSCKVDSNSISCGLS